MSREKLEEIKWDGKKYIRVRDSSSVLPRPYGRVIIRSVGGSDPPNIEALAYQSARQQGLVRVVNAYEKVLTMRGFIAADGLAIKLYQI